MRQVQRIGRTETKCHAMQAQRILRAQLLEEHVRLATWAKIILTVDFEPAGCIRPALDHLSAVWRTQADPGTGRDRRVETVHAPYFLLATTVPPTIFSHAPLGTYTHSSPPSALD